MIRLSGPEDCRTRFGILRNWFGPPAIWTNLNGEITLIDGRVRAAEFDGYPAIGAETPREIVRTLSAAGEYHRAADYVPANITGKTIAAWAGIPLEWVAEMQVHPKTPRSNPQSLDRIEVVRRVRKLLEVADAGESVTATDLRWALGRFALHCRGRHLR